MPEGGKPLRLGEPLLEPFDFGVAHLDERAAPGADQMVMMIVPDLLFIAGLLVPDFDLLGDARLTEEVKVPVDRGEADLGIFPCYPGMELLGGDMTSCGQKGIKDNIALLCAPEPFLSDMG